MENSNPAETAALLLQLDPKDNVGVLTQSVVAGTRLRVGHQDVALAHSLGLGHKLALRDIAVGEKIMKYGCPIGSAITAIPAGDHVHLHNMKSD